MTLIHDFNDPEPTLPRTLHGYLALPGFDPAPVWSYAGVTPDDTVFVGDPSDPDNLVATDIVALSLSPYFRQPGDVDTVPASLRRHPAADTSD